MLSGEKFNPKTTNMSAMELKNRGDRKKMMSHVRNLVALAYADGKFSDEERQYVANVATEVGMTADEMKQIINDPDGIRFIMPENDIEKIEQLYDLILLMMIDGDLNENEMIFCRAMAIKMKIPYQVVDEMVAKVINFITDNFYVEDVVNELAEMMEKKD